ncbi:MAG: hypothetical protein R2708_28325 [Vicinamibacterales bacterium]
MPTEKQPDGQHPSGMAEVLFLNGARAHAEHVGGGHHLAEFVALQGAGMTSTAQPRLVSASSAAEGWTFSSRAIRMRLRGNDVSVMPPTILVAAHPEALTGRATSTGRRAVPSAICGVSPGSDRWRPGAFCGSSGD